MSHNPKNNHLPKANVGKYILESISIGMYDHPLMVIREYIQNSTDSIDSCFAGNSEGITQCGVINIDVDGKSKSMTITDNGTGVQATSAWNVLHDLGTSNKNPKDNRGFRGIGRLGGLGYCDELRFITKAKGEAIISTSIWDCKKIRLLISDRETSTDIDSLIKEVVTFQQQPSDDLKGHFFTVEMKSIRSSRNILLNVPAIKSYVSQIAPVPFSKDFKFAERIEESLRDNVPTYQTYNIAVNGEKICKPYCNIVSTTKGACEEMGEPTFLNLRDESGNALAFAWIGQLQLLGTILPTTLIDGIRVRSGNILIGDKDLLSEFYRERRFSNYMVGEIHISDSRLLPNARRDDFEDSNLRDQLYTSFIKEVGLPFSKKIRDSSKTRNVQKEKQSFATIRDRAIMIAKCGYLAESQKIDIENQLTIICNDGYDSNTKKQAVKLLGKVKSSEHVLVKRNGKTQDSSIDSYQQIFELIYHETSEKKNAEALIEKILDRILS